ncbi:hypothetical protein K6V98_05185 [Collinsella sp. AGMB00827]|uniref:LPXTG cell wall anchor domain-containing protein n=1 Tax=Collinsella ureilytica TaxID=2869515 RepID=A0ABS7MK52_9ACTN|nr:hypothetical protein [Collinsella urealyticum]
MSLKKTPVVHAASNCQSEACSVQAAQDVPVQAGSENLQFKEGTAGKRAQDARVGTAPGIRPASVVSSYPASILGPQRVGRKITASFTLLTKAAVLTTLLASSLFAPVTGAYAAELSGKASAPVAVALHSTSASGTEGDQAAGTAEVSAVLPAAASAPESADSTADSSQAARPAPAASENEATGSAVADTGILAPSGTAGLRANAAGASSTAADPKDAQAAATDPGAAAPGDATAAEAVSPAAVPADSAPVPLTAETVRLIAEGKIRLENSHVDSLLYGQAALDPGADDDGDGKTNAEEVYTYTKGGRTYYGYHSHPRIKDSDGDGLPDGADDQPLRWNVSARDAALMMELAYTGDAEAANLLTEGAESIDTHGGNHTYDLIHRELAPFWTVVESFHLDNGYDAHLLKTASRFPYLEQGTTQMLAIRGTDSSSDYDDDAKLALGFNPGQATSQESVLDSIHARGLATNLTVTGHSLGGYLAQRALIYASGKGYPWMVKSYTFNAPRIIRSFFSYTMRRLADAGDRLTQEGKAVHYKVDNDNVIRPVGWFDGAVSVGSSAHGHGSQSYYEPAMDTRPDFNIGDRQGMSGVGYVNPLLAQLNFDTSLTDADVYSFTAAPEELVEGSPANLLDNLDLKSLPAGAELHDVTDYAAVDLSNPGDYEGTLRVVFQDGSKKDIPVAIHVKAKPFSELYDVVADASLVQPAGEVPTAEQIMSHVRVVLKGTSELAPASAYTVELVGSVPEKNGAAQVQVTWSDGSGTVVRSISVQYKEPAAPAPAPGDKPTPPADKGIIERILDAIFGPSEQQPDTSQSDKQKQKKDSQVSDSERKNDPQAGDQQKNGRKPDSQQPGDSKTGKGRVPTGSKEALRKKKQAKRLPQTGDAVVLSTASVALVGLGAGAAGVYRSRRRTKA